MIVLGPIPPQDDAFPARVYAGSRAEELAITRWSEEQRANVCRRQFDIRNCKFGAETYFAAQSTKEVTRCHVTRDQRRWAYA
jgi:hypothetical protein